MCTPFIIDLIDHKERVAKYMRVAADMLSQRLIYFGNPDEHGETLFDIVDIACTKKRYPSQPYPFDLTEQMYALFSNTVNWLAPYKGDSDYKLRLCFVSDFFQRAAVHDNSKFSAEEFDLFEQAFPVLAKHAYGSDDYKAGLDLLGPALKHHYLVNDHHPEYFKDGVIDMWANQQIEMCCDWIAASERSQRDIFEGLEINKVRFGIDDALFPVLRNTIVALKEGTA